MLYDYDPFKFPIDASIYFLFTIFHWLSNNQLFFSKEYLTPTSSHIFIIKYLLNNNLINVTIL